MSDQEIERKAVAKIRKLAEKIRHELLDPELNVRNLCAMVEQTAGVIREELDVIRKSEKESARATA